MFPSTLIIKNLAKSYSLANGTRMPPRTDTKDITRKIDMNPWESKNDPSKTPEREAPI